jgi:hypothetical protein
VDSSKSSLTIAEKELKRRVRSKKKEFSSPLESLEEPFWVLGFVQTNVTDGRDET